MMNKWIGPVLAITSGDPCGIGPEVILKAAGCLPRLAVRWVVIGELEVFEQTARRLKSRLPRWKVRSIDEWLGSDVGGPAFIDVRRRGPFRASRPSAAAGAASLAYLNAAIRLARLGRADALVTGPVTKWSIEPVQKGFVGQTEHLAKAFGVSEVVMMFVSPGLRVSLLTRHLALRRVSSRVSRALVRRTILMTMQGLRRDFGLREPRLAVCGLNPHAGEHGLFGAEERRVLLPVLRELQHAGHRVEGPFAADGFFASLNGPACAAPIRSVESAAGRYHAVVCWYHDQGLIPFKLLARDRGCQLSLGLPIVRTSPDHGSALDIAGTGCAHPGSMRYAIQLAARLIQRVHGR